MRKRFVPLISVLVVAMLAIIGFTTFNSNDVQAAARDCDSNAIIYCGAHSVGELQQKYNQNAKGDLPQIFSKYGIHGASSFNGAVACQVHSNGNVTHGGRVVATGAQSVGRQYMSGSHKLAGTNVWERPTTVSFRSGSIASFCKISNGQFQWAVITSCGNPVRANAVAPPVKPVAKRYGVVITKTVSDSYVSVGDEVKYKITTKNTSNTFLSAAKLADEVPQGLEFVSASHNGVYDGENVVWDMGRFPAGISITRYVTARVEEGAEGKTIENTACVDASEVEIKCDDAVIHVKEIVEPVVVERVVREEVVVEKPVPQELPNTGPAPIATAMAGSATLTMSAYAAKAYFGSRRKLLTWFLDK